MILLTTSGTRLMCDAGSGNSGSGERGYVASLRNWSATVTHLVAHHPHVALIGAGSRGEFREEDQLGCAWIAAGLLAAGYEPWNAATTDVIERWDGQPADAAMQGKSAAYLSDTGQEKDLAFILDHIDDLDQVFTMVHGEVVQA
jgi:2-phosphosulfolactate phosphatase